MTKINKYSFIILLTFLCVYTIYFYKYKIGAFYYSRINPNDSIKIINLNLNNLKGYTDIIQEINKNEIPSFIYFNTRFDYNRLIKDKVDLLRLDSLYKSDKLNLVYIANGLEDEPSEKDKWTVMINKLNLTGTHISLPDSFPDFDSFFKTTKLGEGHQTTSVPHYLLANRQNIITDTIYEGRINIDKIKLIIEK